MATLVLSALFTALLAGLVWVALKLAGALGRKKER